METPFTKTEYEVWYLDNPERGKESWRSLDVANINEAEAAVTDLVLGSVDLNKQRSQSSISDRLPRFVGLDYKIVRVDRVTVDSGMYEFTDDHPVPYPYCVERSCKLHPYVL